MVRRLQPKVGHTAFIAVDGHGGSGKSTFANVLSGKLGASVIRTDDFASWENPANWWPLVIERVFEPIQNGAKTLRYPRSKWWDNHFPEPMADQPVTPIMVLEGVSSSRKEFREYISLSVFIDAPRELCLQRGVERDRGTGKSPEELRIMWEGWLNGEEEYFLRDHPKEHADLLIDGTKNFEDQIFI